MGIEYQNQKANEDRFREKLKIKSRSKFVGVRQRASGKWAAEIKDTSKKIRMWLGTYQTAEEAARAYDEAAFLLRGSDTRTNFSTHDIATNSPISLKLRNLLDRKAVSNQIQVQNKSSIVSPTFLSADVATMNSSIMALEHNSACSREGKSLFWLQNQASDNLFGIDMNMITAPNTSQFDYFWPLAQQSINNELTVPKDGFHVERQLSTLSAMNECNVEDTYDGYKYEHDVNYPLSQFFGFT